MAHINKPSLWFDLIPVPDENSHKYIRGCSVIFAGEKMTGAARLAAESCMRVGSGLCIVVSPEKAGIIYRTALPAHIIVEDLTQVEDHLADERRRAVLIGPGAGQVKDAVLTILKTGKPCVLDADALTAFEGDTQTLFENLHDKCVLTPHEGELRKLFPELTGTPVERAAGAAVIAGCVVLLKGHESPVAQAGRETRVLELGGGYLATAGSGDVLAGMITGFLAQGLSAFEAASAAVYIHRDAGRCGPGLVASDLPGFIPGILARIADLGS